MALLEQINRVINQLEKPEDSSDEWASDSSEQIQHLVDLLCGQLESQEEPASEPQPDSTEEIHHLVNLLVEQRESPTDGCRDSADSADSADETDRLLDLLLNLIKPPQDSELTDAELANAELTNHESSNSSHEMLSESLSQDDLPGDDSENSAGELRSFAELFPDVTPPTPEAVPPTVNDLTEQLIQAIQQPAKEPVVERSPQAPPPQAPPPQAPPPQPPEEISSEPDPEEVERSLEFLRQLMFPSQSPQSSQTKGANTETDRSTNESAAELLDESATQLIDEWTDRSTNQLTNQSAAELTNESAAESTNESAASSAASSAAESAASSAAESAASSAASSTNESAASSAASSTNESAASSAASSAAELTNESAAELINQYLFSAPPSQQTKPNHEPSNNSPHSDLVEVEILPTLGTENQKIQGKSEFDILQSLLVNSELDPIRDLSEQLDRKLSEIDRKIHDPQQLINLLMPVIAELLNLKVEESKDDIARALAPIIDRAIQQRSQQDKQAMSTVFASLIPEAISYQIKNSPEDIAKAIAPEIAPAIREQIRLDRAAIANVLAPQMGDAIKEQIKLEQEVMVDALYPVIGSTVAKYIAEAIRDINDKIAKALSGEGISRKIRAKLHGISEGELILQESISSIVQGVFLIHKESGLIISECQPPDQQQLESEMVAGMLTAIRSFVNDCIVQSGEVAELDDIEYGLSTIKLEVAGYCYLAAVIKGGDPPKEFIANIRKTLSKIVLYYSKPIQEFDGDPESIPPQVHESIAELLRTSDPEKQKGSLPLLQTLLVVAAGLMFVPFGWNAYKNSLDRRQETQVLGALNARPELAIYAFNVRVDRDTLTVSGKLPNHLLRSQAEAIVKNTAPTLKLNNKIVAVEVPTDPVLVEQEVERIAETLNKMAGISITAKYEQGKVIVDGIVIQETDSQNIARSFAKIPGVNSVVSAVQLQPLTIGTRIYFQQNSSKIKPEDAKTKLVEIKRFLTQYPQVHLNIVGHSDRTGNRSTNQRLALKRAETVQKTLISMGLSPERLNTSANPEPPVDVDLTQPEWKHRCVIFYPIIPSGNQP